MRRRAQRRGRSRAGAEVLPRYGCVPRTPADQQYVIQTLPSAKLVLHKSGCWAADGRLTPVPPGQGGVALRFDDTEPCQICTPKP
jgi:hypothetical protein